MGMLFFGLLRILPIKCFHPHAALHVERDSTEKKLGNGFTVVTHNLYCQLCGESLATSYAKTPPEWAERKGGES